MRYFYYNSCNLSQSNTSTNTSRTRAISFFLSALIVFSFKRLRESLTAVKPCPDRGHDNTGILSSRREILWWAYKKLYKTLTLCRKKLKTQLYRNFVSVYNPWLCQCSLDNNLENSLVLNVFTATQSILFKNRRNKHLKISKN